MVYRIFHKGPTLYTCLGIDQSNGRPKWECSTNFHVYKGPTLHLIGNECSARHEALKDHLHDLVDGAVVAVSVVAVFLKGYARVVTTELYVAHFPHVCQ